MRKLLLLTAMVLFAFAVLTMFDVSVAQADSGSSGFSVPEVLAQDYQNNGGSSTPRIRARSIKGLIYLGIAVISGIGWVIKKMIGSE